MIYQSSAIPGRLGTAVAAPYADLQHCPNGLFEADDVGERELRSSGFVAGDDGVHQGDVLTDVAGDVG